MKRIMASTVLSLLKRFYSVKSYCYRMTDLKVRKRSAKNQFLAAAVVSLYTTAFGLSYGWASPSTVILTSDKSPLPSGKITMDEASWVASLPCFGGLLGNIIFGFITSTFGRKMPLIFMAIPSVMSWFLILFAQNIYYLYAARLLNGMTGGGMYILIPLFVSEISNDSLRGTLGSLAIVTTNFGLLLSFIMGTFCDYYFIPKFTIVVIIVYAVSFTFFHESPTFLLKQNRIIEAENSIRFYKDINESDKDNSLQMEMDKLRSTVGSSDKKEKSSFNWSDLLVNPGRWAFLMAIGLGVLYELCGVVAMLNYTGIIFQETGSNLSPDVSAIIVGAIQFIGSLVTTNLADRAGRKLLYILSTIGTAFGLSTLGIYMMLKSWGYHVEDHNWIPITSFSLVLFLAAWAILTLPFVVVSETMPEKMKEFGTSCCVALVWSLEFILIKCLPLLMETLGFYGSLFMFAGICLSSAIIIALFMPETKGKSHEEIMKMLQ